MVKKVSIENLLYLRVFALCMVVLRHSFAPFTGAWDTKIDFELNEFVSILGQYVSSISMPLYIFISGLLFSFLRNKLDKYPTMRILIKKKTKRLLIPYIVFAPLYILTFLTFDNVKEFIFHFWKGAGHLWFLTMIFFTFLVFYLLEEKFKNNFKLGFILVLLFFCFFPFYFYLRLGPFAQTLYYFPFFYIGYFFYFKHNIINKWLYNKKLILLCSHTIIFLITIYVQDKIVNDLFKSIFNGYMKLPLGILSICIIFSFFNDMQMSKNVTFNNLLNNISEKSYYIYIIHQPLLKLLYSSPFLLKIKPSWVISISFLSTLLLSLLFSSFIMKYKLGRKLIGA
ncbi:acyltransferase family protein [Maribacter stanieri]|uniref:acyltransferase family protein n=1 Tax=Maribacter stanieri TaxID=440514 RepID=UPI002494C861|nr:acyltransferase [Maribacter stanieri]